MIKHFWKNAKVPYLMLNKYDNIVNKVNCTYVWQCHPNNIFNLYKSSIKKNHLEIGAGTGFFLKPFMFDRLHLIDINERHLNLSYNKMKKNANYISTDSSNIFNANYNKKPPIVNSVGISYVLHCIDGKLDYLLNNLIKNLSQKNVIIFGSTVLPISNNIIANTELHVLNQLNIFNNYNHKIEDFNSINEKYDTSFNIIGNVLLFKIKI